MRKMNIPNPILILSFLFLFLFNHHRQTHTIVIALASTETSCLDSVCQTNEPIIRFPFHIEDKQANTCGYPGFKVLCSEKNQTLLKLPYWGELSIQTINYAKQELRVNDPNNCLPKRLLSLNLSNSPFNAVYYQQFSFFNCSFNLEYLTSRYKPIPRLSDSFKYSVFATPSLTAFVHLSSICDLVDTVNVPVQSPFYDQVLSSDLNDDLRLTWNSPPCGRCESHGGRCGFLGNSTFELACYNVPSRKGTIYYSVTLNVYSSFIALKVYQRSRFHFSLAF